MTAEVIDGRAVAARLRADVARRAEAFRSAHGRAPCLATVLVGADPASAMYIRMKRAACRDAGIRSEHVELAADVTEQDLLDRVEALAMDRTVDGILVQMPLPPHIDEDAVVRAVPPELDVDGFHPENLGALAAGSPALATCTPAGIMHLLDAYGVELEGADAVVIGRSRVVGLPMALLLLARDATVTVTHHLSRDLAAKTRTADVLISATGVAGLVTRDMVKPGAVVIDVGTIRTEDGLVGDVDFDEVCSVARLITPVPGGVGPMTIAQLLDNTMLAAERRAAAATVA